MKSNGWSGYISSNFLWLYWSWNGWVFVRLKWRFFFFGNEYLFLSGVFGYWIGDWNWFGRMVIVYCSWWIIIVNLRLNLNKRVCDWSLFICRRFL